ncbi:hypothetical protein BJX62DRAFT_201229 [Aspergillus germanicus]
MLMRRLLLQLLLFFLIFVWTMLNYIPCGRRAAEDSRFPSCWHFAWLLTVFSR